MGIRMLIITPGDSSQGCDSCVRTSQIWGSSRSGPQLGDPPPLTAVDTSESLWSAASYGAAVAGWPPFPWSAPAETNPHASESP